MKVARALLMCVGIVAAACGQSRATETANGAAIRWVDVDGRTNRFNGSFLSYFPSDVSVRPGDVVVFRSIWNGEPHTVTMGALVDRAFTGPATLRSVPQWTLGTSGFLPANVGRPCYLNTGPPPADPRKSCAIVERRPTFNGRQSFYSSGFLPAGTRFRVELARDIEPGTYRFFCAFQGPRMSGSIRVVAPGADIPSQGDIDDAAKKRLGAFVDGTLPTHARMYKPFDRARAGRFPWPALASLETQRGTVKVLEFVPFTLKAKVGERVRWSILGAHTIAFDAPENAKPPAIRILNTGETELKADAFNESRSPEPPSGAPRRPVVLEVDDYKEGFLSSGMLYSPRRGLITYVVRFSDPGSYRYECLVHPRMTGLVIVSV